MHWGRAGLIAAVSVGGVGLAMGQAPVASSVAQTSPVATSPAGPVIRLPGGIGEVTNVALNADGSARLLSSSPLALRTVSASGEISAALRLLPDGADDLAQAELTSTGATVFYAPDPERPVLVARDVSGTGEVREQVLGTPARRFGRPWFVDAGNGSQAVGVVTGKGRFRDDPKLGLLYRAAGAPDFTATPAPLTGDTSYTTFAFFDDGTGVLATQSDATQPAFFRRIGRDGQLGAPMRLGRFGKDTWAIDMAVAPDGAVDVAILESTSSNPRERGVIRVAELPAGANAFGPVQTVARVPVIGDDSLSISRDRNGTLTVVNGTYDRLRLFRGPVGAVRRTRGFEGAWPTSAASIPTEDGATTLLWVAQRSFRKAVAELKCSRWSDASGWSVPTVLASARAINASEDEGGSNPGIWLAGAKPWPGGGIGVVYRLDTAKGSPTYLRRLPAGGC